MGHPSFYPKNELQSGDTAMNLVVAVAVIVAAAADIVVVVVVVCACVVCVLCLLCVLCVCCMCVACYVLLCVVVVIVPHIEVWVFCFSSISAPLPPAASPHSLTLTH